jgi:hypothetical protein
MNDLFENPTTPEHLTDRELLEEIHAMLAALTARKARPKVNGVPQRRHQYEPDFEALWAVYPKRNGGNSKWKAQQCWRARIREGAPNEVAVMHAGVERYAAWCQATGKTGTELVMQATRFLGPGKEYEHRWDLPAPETKVIKIPANGEKLVAFAHDYGLQPGTGESWYEFRQRVEAAVEASA